MFESLSLEQQISRFQYEILDGAKGTATLEKRRCRNQNSGTQNSGLYREMKKKLTVFTYEMGRRSRIEVAFGVDLVDLQDLNELAVRYFSTVKLVCASAGLEMWESGYSCELENSSKCDSWSCDLVF